MTAPDRLVYFVSDVHLGLQVLDPEEREKRFTEFLLGIDAGKTDALYMLGDIWDFWYEWKYTIPKGYLRVLSALVSLIDKGVKIYFFQGNHDVWTYSYFEELGMKRLVQPAFVEIGGQTFCLGHGDALGDTSLSYRIMRGIFHNKAAQWAFSKLVHPDFAMALGNAWSHNNRLKRTPYLWKGQDEPLYKYAQGILEQRPVDYFIFGHLHVAVQDVVFAKCHNTEFEGENVRTARLIILDSWLNGNAEYIHKVTDKNP